MMEAEGSYALLHAVQAAQAHEAAALVTPMEVAGSPRLLVYADAAKETLIAGAPLPAEMVSALEAAARAALSAGKYATVTVHAGAQSFATFIEILLPPARLIICGAGHIAVPLAQIATLCGYAVTVIDDRAAFANRERFPTAAALRVGDFRRELQALRDGRPHFGARTSLVLVTRGHQHDVECLVEVIGDELEYVGMIGSRRRIRAVFELLAREYGIARAALGRVHAPIGLDIGSQTPAEIAVAIVAEMINGARGGPALSLSRTLSSSAASLRDAANKGTDDADPG